MSKPCVGHGLVAAMRTGFERVAPPSRDTVAMMLVVPALSAPIGTTSAPLGVTTPGPGASWRYPSAIGTSVDHSNLPARMGISSTWKPPRLVGTPRHWYM